MIKVPSHLIRTARVLLGYLLGAGVVKTITHLLKYSVGRLRPHFLSVCQPDWAALECATQDAGALLAAQRPLYVTNYTCAGNHDLFEGAEVEERVLQSRLSFPSGHASFSAQAMTFVALYLQARMAQAKRGSSSPRRRRRRGDDLYSSWLWRSFAVPFVQFCAAAFAAFVSASRVSDYKHHPGDVLAGAALGVAAQAANVVWVLRLFEPGEEEKKGGEGRRRKQENKYRDYNGENS